MLPGHWRRSRCGIDAQVLATAADWGALRCGWSVNQKTNAQRFYAKTGFKIQQHQDVSTGSPPREHVMVRGLYDPTVRASRAGMWPAGTSFGIHHFLAEDGVQLSAGRHHQTGVIEPINERHQPQRNGLVVVRAPGQARSHLRSGWAHRDGCMVARCAQRVEVVKGRPNTCGTRSHLLVGQRRAGAGSESRCR